MSIDELQRVRDANPVSEAPHPPPFRAIARRVDEERSEPSVVRLSWLRRRVPALGAVFAATTAAALVIVIGVGSDRDASATSLRSGGVLLGDYFAVFRRPADAGSDDNPFASPAPRTRLGRLSVDPASARRLDLPGAAVWVAADNEQVCLSVHSNFENSVGGACARPVQILQEGLFTAGSPSPAYVQGAGLPPGTTQIAGLLPDGVDTVTFTLADGSRRGATVTDNGVALTLPSWARSVSFRDRHNVLRTRPM